MLQPRLWQALTDIPEDHRQQVARQLTDGAQPAATYYVMISLACVIATTGLITDSTAVIIGAMLVSPLMGPIVGLAAGIVSGHGRLVWLALLTLGSGAAFAVLAAIGMTSTVLWWAPDLLSELPREIVARTRPTLFDLAIALVGGLAGAYATAHPRLSSALPGVAIATALMPPLCTVGILLTLGEPDAARGAFLLFLANFAAISASAALVLYALGFWREARQTADSRRRAQRGLIGFAVALVVVAVPLGTITAGVVHELRDARELRLLMDEALAASLPTEQAAEARIVSVERKDGPKGVTLRVTVQSPQPPDRSILRMAQEAAAEYLGQPVQLSVLVSPIARLEAITPVSTPSPAPQTAFMRVVGLPPRPAQTRQPLLARAATPAASPAASPAAAASPLPSPAPMVTASPVVSPAVSSGAASDARTTGTPTLAPDAQPAATVTPAP